MNNNERSILGLSTHHSCIGHQFQILSIIAHTYFTCQSNPISPFSPILSLLHPENKHTVSPSIESSLSHSTAVMVMAVSILSPLNTITTPTPNLSSRSSLSPFFFFNSSLKFPPRRPSFIVFSYDPKESLSSQDKRELYERYGLDPNDFVTELIPKRKRGKGAEKKVGRGKQVAVEEDQQPPARTTHKLLQVLSGKAKRKKLLSPVGMNVRPMMEVVKGAAFDILQVAGGCPASLRPGCWLDLYSGTGSVGIEALSRGCSEVHFVEMDPWVVSNVLQPNLQWTGFLDASVIHTIRVENFLKQARQFVGNDVTFDYISVTPPYMEVDYGLLMGQISDSSLVGEDTFIVVEYPLGTDMLDSCGCLTKIADRRFGRTHLAIYGPKWAQKKRK